MSEWKEGFIARFERRFSRAVGLLANANMPHVLYRPVSRLTCWLLGVSDYEPDLKRPQSLNAIFERPHQTCLLGRDFPVLSSPADGTIASFGKIQRENGTMLPAKQSLIPVDKSRRIHSQTCLFYIGVYLSPRDNHNVYSPSCWRIRRRTHYPGILSTVRPQHVRSLAANERVEYDGIWQHGYFSLTLIGALNVGSIHVYSDPQLRTNDRADDLRLAADTAHTVPLKVAQNRYQPFGYFSLGSYVLLVFEAPKTFRFDCRRGQTVRKGKSLGSIQ